MNYLKKSISVLIAVWLCCCIFVRGGAVSVYAGEVSEIAGDGSGYKIIYSDEAGLITGEDKEELIDVMREISREANVIFYTTRSATASNAGEISARVCASYFGSSKTSPVVMFTIDMAHREIYMYCTGDIRHIIRNAEANTITDNVYKYASDAQYGKCAIEAFRQADMCLDGRQIKRPMQIINNLLLALILGFTANFIFLKVSRARAVKRINKKTKEMHCVSSINVDITKNMIKSYSYTMSESSGGSGGGGSSSGGGGCSGGGGGSSGGGHSF